MGTTGPDSGAPYAPQTTGGSGLGDLLAGIGGAPVNRVALGGSMIQGQALAGLRTAQTEDALTKAMAAREQMASKDQFEQALVGLKGPDGNPTYTPSQAHAVALGLQAGGGNFEQLVAGLKGGNQVQAQGVLGNTANIGTPQAIAAGQVLEGKPASPYQSVPLQYAPTPGVPQQPTVVSPMGQSEVNAHNATANAATARAANPSQQAVDPAAFPIIARYVDQNPGAAGNMRSLTMGQGPMVAVAYMAEHGDPEAQALMSKRYGTPQPAPGPAQPPGSATPDNPNGAVGRPASPPLTAEDLAPAGPAIPVAPGHGPAAVTPFLPGQDQHNAPMHTPPNGIVPAPGVSLAEQAAIRKDFASGTGAKQVTSLNTMFQHSQLFDKIADQIGNGNFTPTNEINVLWKKATGSPVPTNLQTAASFLGREAVRATVSSGAGTGEERELAISPSASPDQLHGAAQTLRSLALGQLNSLDLRARRGGVDINQLLTPETQAGFGRGPHGAATVVAPATGLPSAADIAAELARRGVQ